MVEPVKYIHVTAVIVSIGLFILRLAWMYAGSPLLQSRFARFVPHVNDTFLLASGIALAVMIAQYPLVHAWITAKILLLPVYIALGMAALKRGKTPAARAGAGAAAIMVYAYIAGIALTKSINPISLAL